MNEVKVALFIQIVNSFVNGILAIVLPLMMKERNISLVAMGLIFASMPLIMQLGRVFFATLSDFWGRKLFFVLNGFLCAISNSIYYLAHAPLEFLFGKVIEGTKDGSLWAVNRAFLMEKNESKFKILVRLRAAANISYAVGSLLAGFLVVLLFYEGTLLFCVVAGALVIPASLLLASSKKEKFNATKALRLLDFRRKRKIFKIFLILFFIMGLSFGFRSGFILPLFLNKNQFDVETIGIIISFQALLNGLFAYLLASRVKLEKLILGGGILCTLALVSLGLSSPVFTGILVLAYGITQGLLGAGEEGIISETADKNSYGADIALIWTGHHIGETLGLAISGLLVQTWGFAATFLISASILTPFFITSYITLKKFTLD